MLKRFIPFLILLAVSATAIGQDKIFHAEFRSLLDGEKVMYATVSNSYGDSKLTNSDGYVNIRYQSGSFIKVSHIGYDSLSINPSNFPAKDTVLFYLAPRTFVLREFQYSILGPRHTFDNKFVDTKLGKSDIERVKEQLGIEDLESTLVALDQSAADGVRLGSPITALYDQFSKAGKERRKYAELLAGDVLDSLTREKYNLRLVQSLTALYEPLAAQEFMDFCSFDERYIEQTEKVEIYFEILRCKDEYDRLNELSPLR